MKEYEELKAQGLTARIEDCHKRLYAYGGKELEEGGQIQVEISARDNFYHSFKCKNNRIKIEQYWTTIVYYWRAETDTRIGYQTL